ncbi:transposase-like zinc-binding domain-containing protein [Gallibacterium melopsittaci]|uniref:transposase-like zinc-binding domain-containing protein n=1 Tax=Gallibacterium melopsittaci TaxID=516063 RepID=UPI00406BB220
MKKHGTSNNIQRYFCHHCHKTFTFKNKLVPNKIWSDYTSGKQRHSRQKGWYFAELCQYFYFIPTKKPPFWRFFISMNIF